MSNWKWIETVVLEKEYVTVFCKTCPAQQLFVNKQKVIISIINHIIIVLFVLHWQD
jgi:hypothetical protein